MAQPIIRGIQSVGQVNVKYRFNGPQNILYPPSSFSGLDPIDTSNFIEVAGFRLDSEFIRTAQQIASSAMIPLLGGGGLALTNNNRTGTFTINCSRVSSPETAGEGSNGPSMHSEPGLGVVGGATVYDLVLIAQMQQATAGGDDSGATIDVEFDFNHRGTKIRFDACTIANVSPLTLAGNDAAGYSVEINYLNWEATFSNVKLTG